MNFPLDPINCGMDDVAGYEESYTLECPKISLSPTDSSQDGIQSHEEPL
ncbi:MAG: hypothetical protein IBV52_08590 [Candidatus Bathyarchaeota archaeon]